MREGSYLNQLSEIVMAPLLDRFGAISPALFMFVTTHCEKNQKPTETAI